MDTINTYRDIVKQITLHYAELRPSHGDIRPEIVFDETRDRYALMQVGWDRGRRVRGNLLYVTLKDGKVYLEYDGIGYGITDDLVAGGIPEQDIVLAYLPNAPTLVDYNRMKTQTKVRLRQAKSAIGAAV
jgi:XisI protein